MERMLRSMVPAMEIGISRTPGIQYTHPTPPSVGAVDSRPANEEPELDRVHLTALPIRFGSPFESRPHGPGLHSLIPTLPGLRPSSQTRPMRSRRLIGCGRTDPAQAWRAHEPFCIGPYPSTLDRPTGHEPVNVRHALVEGAWCRREVAGHGHRRLQFSKRNRRRFRKGLNLALTDRA